jgi:hypothetical protein
MPDGSYRFRVIVLLVARQNGKSHVGRVLLLWRLYVDGARLILGVGQDVSLAREIWSACLESIQGVPELAAELDVVRRVNGDEWFRLTGGGRYKIVASNKKAGRGLSVDLLDFEELRTQKDWAAWSSLSKTTSARPNGQIFAFSNAGDESSVVLNQLRANALAGADDSLAIFEWSAPAGCDLNDRQAWALANPALNHPDGISEAAIRSSLATDPPAVFRTEVLCQHVDQLDGAFQMDGWQAGRDAAGTLDAYRDRLVVGLAVAADLAHITLAVAALLPDGRPRVEIRAAWTDTGRLRDDLAGIIEAMKPRALAWFPGSAAAALAVPIRGLTAKPPAAGKPLPRADRDKPIGLELTGGRAGEALQGLADLVAARRVVHGGDPLLDAHLAGAQRKATPDGGWTIVRRGAGHVDAAEAAAAAVYGVLTLPTTPRRAAFAV